ncbi:Motile sperm domain-containing protein 2 [Halotydeus destructor]|nr:Motile sperm domain-containing protein 2 [Halotydeus destructor]
MSARSVVNFDSSIEQVRSEFLEQVESQNLVPSQVYQEDVDKVRSEAWFVRRFLVHNQGCPELALDQLVAALKWRKEMALRDTLDNYFPHEMYRTGSIFLYERTATGQPTLYIRLKRVRKVHDIAELVKRYLSYLLWKLDEMADGHGWVLVFDFQGAGISNCDLEMARHIIGTITKHLPTGLAFALVVDFPWILRTFWTLVKGLIPDSRRSLLKFCSVKEIADYIDKSKIPSYLGGTCYRPYQGWALAPPGCPSAVDFGVDYFGLPEDKVEKFFLPFQPLLIEDINANY